MKQVPHKIEERVVENVPSKDQSGSLIDFDTDAVRRLFFVHLFVYCVSLGPGIILFSHR